MIDYLLYDKGKRGKIVMKMTKKEEKILKKYFGIHKSKYANGLFYELEQWTDGGVDMIISLSDNEDKSITEQFRDYVDNFDIDEEIELYREGKDYREAFTIRQSVEDFESWVEYITDIANELESEV